MTQIDMTLPRVVSRDELLAARKKLLAKEKVLHRQRDGVNADRRRPPMVRIEKDYVFDGPAGKTSLPGLFEERRQLMVYHFMFDPGWDEGCPSCSYLVDNVGHLAPLHARDTSLALVSRAPLAKVERFRNRMGWKIPWYSSFGSDFNCDFRVTLDDTFAPVEYDYRDKMELLRKGEAYFTSGESHGLSVFFRDGGRIFHTYSPYARGIDLLLSTYNYLDLTPLGRQEDGEGPRGAAATSPFLAWVRHHDRYGDDSQRAESSCGSAA
jgi:predicted dithiol-disulfide oxidoreductase (DUF899 family)